jgi:uncharacterized protein
MRLDNERPSDNVEDRRGQGGGGGFGMPGGGMGGRRINIPMGGGGRGGMSMGTIVMMLVVGAIMYFVFGINPIDMLNGGGNGFQVPTQTTEQQLPQTEQDTSVTAGQDDAGKLFIRRVLGTTEDFWSSVFPQQVGSAYPAPDLVLFSGFVQSRCGMAQSAMGPFYCPNDQKVYIDLSFYNDMKNKLGAPGDFAQAYVIAHEVGHHIQKVLGILDKTTSARMRMSETDANALQVQVELQADCLAGMWGAAMVRKGNVIEDGDIEEGLNAAAAIGDDRLQKRSQGYVVPESFTHGSSAQRVRWFRQGMQAQSIKDCDTFAAEQL